MLSVGRVFDASCRLLCRNFLTSSGGESRKRKMEDDPASKRTKKGKRKVLGAAQTGVDPSGYVEVIPISKKSDLLQEGWHPVQLSKSARALQAAISENRMAMTSWKGYRMVRAGIFKLLQYAAKFPPSLEAE